MGNKATCDKCGAEYGIGEWYLCPHGPCTRFGEDPLEPAFYEMASERGEYFSNRGERRRFMDKRGLEMKPRKSTGKVLFYDMGKRG